MLKPREAKVVCTRGTDSMLLLFSVLYMNIMVAFIINNPIDLDLADKIDPVL